MNLLTRMTLNIGELNKQKFHYNIKDTANPMGSFNFQSEARRHYLFRRKHTMLIAGLHSLAMCLDITPDI